MFGLETCHCYYAFVLDYHDGTPNSVWFLGTTIEINNKVYHEQEYISVFHFLGEGEVAGLEHLLIIMTDALYLTYCLI